MTAGGFISGPTNGGSREGMIGARTAGRDEGSGTYRRRTGGGRRVKEWGTWWLPLLPRPVRPSFYGKSRREVDEKLTSANVISSRGRLRSRTGRPSSSF